MKTTTTAVTTTVKMNRKFAILKSAVLTSAVLGAVATFGVSAMALATVDGIYTHVLISQDIQSNDLCYRTLPVMGEFGVAEGIIAHAVFSPLKILYVRAGRPSEELNINLAATNPAMQYSYADDQPYDPLVPQLSLKVNVSALAQANGLSLTGRVQTIKSAKIALLSLAKNLSHLGQGKYRLKVEFVGLPSQQNLAGEKLNATTQYAYSAASPLLKAYERELINVEGNCAL